MSEKDIINVKTADGKDEEVEVIFTFDKDDKKYLLYKNNDGEIFASYLLGESGELHNDLTDEEYDMLEKIYHRVG